LEGCKAARDNGFRAVKCGWGPFGRGSLADDRDQLQAVREGLGPEGTLLIDAGQICVQIDCGGIGGIGPAKRVADHAAPRGVTYVNHTFTSHLALSASLQPYAGLKDHVICEYPSRRNWRIGR
jgi:L-alanine-DL-glutamate epimerase-like enolase superfamily enzyme